jgi:hypothetical protein
MPGGGHNAVKETVAKSPPKPAVLSLAQLQTTFAVFCVAGAQGSTRLFSVWLLSHQPAATWEDSPKDLG